MTKLIELRDALLEITPNTYHFFAEKQVKSYIVWAEDGQGDCLYADDGMSLQVIQGTVDLFTKAGFDPKFGQVQTALNKLGLSWRLNSIQYERETKYTHYEWEFEFETEVGDGNGQL